MLAKGWSMKIVEDKMKVIFNTEDVYKLKKYCDKFAKKKTAKPKTAEHEFEDTVFAIGDNIVTPKSGEVGKMKKDFDPEKAESKFY